MKILGVDFGDSRTGYAISDILGFAANVLPALKSKSIKNAIMNLATANFLQWLN